MSETLPASGNQHGGTPRALRILGLTAVCVGLAALVAATFVLSYSGIHALALHAGISPRLARGYPLLLDAMLVVVLAAALSLRGAGVPSKLLAWLTLLALLGATAGADALHAAKDKLPARAAEVTAAVLPWVLVFLAFALLLAMLRHARLRRREPESVTAEAANAPDLELADLTIEAGLAADDPSSNEVAVEPASAILGAIIPASAISAENPDLGMPVFHRISSSPMPPNGT